MPKKSEKNKKEVFASPKGMRDIIGDEYYRYQGFFEKAQEIAVYYGFKPIETPVLEKEGVFTGTIGEDSDIVEKEMYNLKTKGGDHLVLRPEATAPVMRAYIENGMQSWPQPVMLYYSSTFYRHERPQRGRFREFRQFGLEILGSPKSIADAIIIQTTLAILKEAGIKNPCVNINSLGDKESRNAYLKELSSYFRKHINKLTPEQRQKLKQNPLRLLDSKDLKLDELRAEAPDSISMLSPDSKKHFKEVLEYLESMGIEYKIDNTLVRGLDYYSKTVFEITHSDDDVAEEPKKNVEDKEKENKEKDGADTEEIKATPLSIAGGGRYDYLAKRLGSKKDVSGVGVGIGVDRILMDENVRRLDPKVIKKPKIYFIQLGFDAKLKSLIVIEILRKAKVPIMQTLSKDSLIGQLSVAEKLSVPYTIIFGQKEALSDTVIIRKMDTRSQNTVKISELAEYLKKLK